MLRVLRLVPPLGILYDGPYYYNYDKMPWRVAFPCVLLQVKGDLNRPKQSSKKRRAKKSPEVEKFKTEGTGQSFLEQGSAVQRGKRE